MTKYFLALYMLTAMLVPVNARPNIVIINVDDLGWNDINYLKDVKSPYYTPNIEKLASQSMVFSNGYASCPVCSPTRASLVTGKSPAALKLTAHIPGNPSYERTPKEATLRGAEFIHQLPLEEITFAEVLKKEGYATGFIGKWHLAGSGSKMKPKAKGAVAPGFHPDRQGFDINIGGCSFGQPPNYFSPYKNATITDGPKEEYLTDRLTNEALNYIEANKDKSFLLYLNPYSVHTPLAAPKERMGFVKSKLPGKMASNKSKLKYATMIYSVDLLVGALTEKLDTLKLTDNTLVILTSDNGGLFGNAPLRDNKGTLYEGGIRVPYIIRWPGVVESGSHCDEPIISYDIFPTIVDAAGHADKIPEDVEGQSLLPLFKKKSFSRNSPLFWHYPHYHHGGMKSFDMGSTIRDGDWKFTHIFKTGKNYLFNLNNDLHEDNNLYDSQPERAEKLQKKLFTILKKVDANMPTSK